MENTKRHTMRIAIPSYKRASTLRNKTLKYLLNYCQVSPDIIDVFVANEEEYKDYEYLQDEGINIIIGVPVLKAQRNFITDYYDEGDKILCMDDDIEMIHKKSGDKTKQFYDVIKLAEIGFNECIKHNTKLWGICAVDNGFFMSNKISTNNKFIVGCFFGYIIDKDINLRITITEKDDYERTIKHYDKFGKVIRLNMFAPKTSYYTEPGGLQTDDRIISSKASALYLTEKYPQYCYINKRRKGDKTQILLKG